MAAPVPALAPVLTLIDASGFIFRAYHAIQHLSTSKGVPTNAVYGFTRMLLKTLREFAPTHVALAFDKDSRLGRQEIDPEYKANRSAPPPDLVPQFGMIRQVVEVLNLPVLEMHGWEADDVIGTLALRARAEGFRVEVVTGDKDFMQIVGDDVQLYDPMLDRRTGPAEVQQRLGITPSQMCDYLALVGDAIDNVPKVPGVGPKTAVELIAQFGTVEVLLDRIQEVKKPKLRDALIAHAETLRRAKRLVTFKTDLELNTSIADLARRPIKQVETRTLFSELEFYRLLQEMPSEPVRAQGTVVVDILDAPEKLVAFTAALQSAGSFGVVGVYEGDLERAPVLGLGMAHPDGRMAYLPFRHSLLGGAAMEPSVAWAILRPLFADPVVIKQGHDLKALTRLLAREGCPLVGATGDVELLSYLLNPSRREHAIEDLSRERLGLELPAGSVPGARQKATPLADLSAPELAQRYGARAGAVQRLASELWTEIESLGLGKLTREIELPLIPILARMEGLGVKVDVPALQRIGSQVDIESAQVLETIHRTAGHVFNVSSNGQLAEVLYNELKLPVLKRGKTGPSTDQEVLEKLAQSHPLPRAILDYRTLTKLKSTYLDTLAELLGSDGRIHTTYHLTGTATGRLSSSDPNLQNIPIRTELGKTIRRAFVAEEGNVLVSADYSQIELRLLAHLAGDEVLIEAFRRDEDVHTRTAAEVFGVTVADVTELQRRAAKMVNFGIAYGLSPHGLSTRLDIPIEEAKSIIDRYFERYAGMRRYLDETLALARQRGYAETLFGRRRWMQELHSTNRVAVQAAERAAINMPLQGTAADIIKMAMARVEEGLRARGLAGRMILQVHDELVFEAPVAEQQAIEELARTEMEAVVQLSVPLRVDVGAGNSWADAG